MAYLDHYRSNPNWATQQWQSIAPPAPAFQPQPSWGGLDFYRATAGPSYDSGLYNYGFDRLQGIGTQGLATMGPSMIEAKICHRRAYGGLGDILAMAPSEIGAAAAYEVWRNWRYNYGTLAQPLGGDSLRQREALVGLAIGEATKLWQHTTRVADSTGRLAAVETAAIAAARIFDQGNSTLMGGGGAYGAGMGTGMGAGMAGGMGALSPAIPGAMMGGGAMSGLGTAGMGMGMGMGMGAGTGMGVAGGIMSPTPVAAQNFGAPPLIRQRSLSAGAASGGYGYGAGLGMGGVPSYAGSDIGGGGYATANGMLAPGGMVGAGMQRPLSSGGIRYGPPEAYAPGGIAETAIARYERHKGERAARRAERAALKGARYDDGYYGSGGRAYDDNYAHEYGRGGGYGGYGSRYGGGYGYDGGSYGGHGELGGRRRRASMYGDGYGYGGRYI